MENKATVVTSQKCMLMLYVVSFSTWKCTPDVHSIDSGAKALLHGNMPRRQLKCWLQDVSPEGKDKPGEAVPN